MTMSEDEVYAVDNTNLWDGDVKRLDPPGQIAPCPCCGHKALIRREGESYGVCCTNCFLEIPSRFERPEEAARQWNRRTPA